MALLTRLPVRARFERSAQAIWAFPLAGLAVAIIAAAVATLAGWATLTAPLIAALALVTPIIVTGAMHEDGLADSADGLWGGFDPARRLEIMRDSRIGAYGVLALIGALLIRFAALSALAHAGAIVPALIAAALLSRAAIGVPMLVLPHARRDGLAVQTGRPPREAVLLGALIALALGWLVAGFVAVVVAACAIAAVTSAVMAIARAKIGGQTGDILGATQLLAELTALITFVALL
ncbi:adenosylcobinamide-GDP ribazoletransferase [Celeribacter sp.]|uniref:adenosylcobinamide-GDP ribazoletransferase n=1 Tax=Celeribacter sp. TaxID=1890673 RepID=UPI003A93436C